MQPSSRFLALPIHGLAVALALSLIFTLVRVASAVPLDAPVSPENLLAPGPELETTELLLENWTVVSRTTLGDGRHEMIASPRVRNTANAQFATARFSLTEAPAGIEIVDGVVDSTVNVPPVVIHQNAVDVVLQDSITLRAPAGTFDPEATFLAGLYGPGFTWSAVASEKLVPGSGVFVVEDITAGLSNGAPFDDRAPLSGEGLPDPNGYVAEIDEDLGGGLYRFLVKDLSTPLAPGEPGYTEVVTSWEQDLLKNGDGTSFITPFSEYLPTTPDVHGTPYHAALVLIGDPAKRALLPANQQAELPPLDLLPRKFQMLQPGPYYNGSNTRYAFYIQLDLADTEAPSVPVQALAQSGTYIGAFGTNDTIAGPADTMGGGQDDPLAPNHLSDGRVEPQYWPSSGLEIVHGLRMDGQVSLAKVTGRALCRIRRSQRWLDPLVPPYFYQLEASAALDHTVALTATADREISLSGKTRPLIPDFTIPLGTMPVGPLALIFSIESGVDLGANGSLSAAATFNWAQSTSTLCTGGVIGGVDEVTGEKIENPGSYLTSDHTQLPASRTEPFLDVDTQADLDGFVRARVGLNLSVNGLMAIAIDANADARASLHVNPTATPWWNLSTGVDTSISLTGSVIGFDVAAVSSNPPASSAPHLAAASPPDPLGRANGADTHWAKTLTYANLPIADDAVDVVPLPDKGLVMLTTLPGISLLLVELDAFGEEVRRRTLGGVLHTVGHPKRVRLLPDGGLLVFASPVLIRLDAAWNVVWKKNLAAPAGNTLRFYDMDVAPGAGADFAAYFAAVTDTIVGTVPTSAVVLKIDASGASVWAKAYVTQGDEGFYTVRVTSDGGCVAGGKTDAKWNDPREFSFEPPVGGTNPFPDEQDNGYLVRIAPDGSVLWAWSAAALSFNALAVQPDGRIGAASSSSGHGFYDPWRGPGIHVFNSDGSRGGATTISAAGMPQVLAEGNLDDYVRCLTTGTDGGWVLACKTGPSNQAPAASFVAGLTPSLNPRWLIGYDWDDSPREIPERIINRGDSYFFAGLLDDGRVNGADAIDGIMLSCLPDSGLLTLLPSNRLTHGFFSPLTDGFGGMGVANLQVVGGPRAITPAATDVALIVNDYAPGISNPATAISFTPLTDIVPAGPAPQLTIASGPDPGALTLSWPAGSGGYSLFESVDLEDWAPSPLVPEFIGGGFRVEPLVGPEPKMFWRIERTAPAQ